MKFIHVHTAGTLRPMKRAAPPQSGSSCNTPASSATTTTKTRSKNSSSQVARRSAGGSSASRRPGRCRRGAERDASHVLALEINGHHPRGILVAPKAQVKQEYYAGVVWDGIRKQPVMLFSDMGGIDIEEVAEQHPDHVGRRHFSNLRAVSDF